MLTKNKLNLLFGILLVLILLLGNSVYSNRNVVHAQADEGGEYEIRPPLVYPRDGTAEIYVPLGDTILIKSGWGACTRGLAQAWTNQNEIKLLLNGASVFLESETSRDFWSEPDGVPLAPDSPCINGTDTLWRVFWEYPLGNLAEGTYTIHYEENVDHPYLDGEDYDGDGQPDIDEWHISVDFNIIVAELGSISGTIIEDGTEMPIEGLMVEACDYEAEWDGPCFYGETEADGSYIIPGVLAGTYRVHTGWDGNWVEEYYPDQIYWDLAEPVEVTVDTDTSDIDFALVMGGTTSGHVSDANGDVAGIHVDVCTWDDSYCAGHETDENGDYIVYGLPEGDYRVSIWGGYGYWVDQFYDHVRDWDSASQVSVTAGQNTENINFDLESGGRISGHVSDANGDVVGVHVDVCTWDDSYCTGNETDENGNYTIYGIPSGDYLVSVWGGQGFWLDQLYDHVRTREEATFVIVTAGQDTGGIDFDLEAGGTISGHVSDANGDVVGLHVDACTWDDSFCAGNETDEFGNYTIFGLPEDDYRVSVWGGQGGWLDEFFEETPFYDDATSVAVIAGSDTPDINFTMEAGGTISGTVYEANSGDPLATIVGVHVDACSTDDTFCNGTETGNAGEYTITGLLPDKTYRVFIWGQPGWASEVYQETIWWDEATIVSTGATGIDFTLDPGGSISGLVSDVDGNPLANIGVDIMDGGYGACTDENGYYSIMGLPFGTYGIVAGRDFCEPHPYVEQAMLGITIDADNPDMGGIDFELAVGGSISGTVTAVGGGLIGDNIDVNACLYDDDSICWWTSKRPDGSYTIDGLPAGVYRVHAYQWPEGYWFDEFFDNTRDWSLANQVVVTEGVNTPEINFSLTQGGAITGVVKDGDGNGIAGLWVEAYQESIDAWSWAQTDKMGVYRILGLPEGDYRVYINPQDGWVGQDYPGNPVTVSPGFDTFDIDFTLVEGGTISGTVTAVGGGLIEENIDVAACLIAEEGVCWGTSVQEDGSYAISGLPAGEYDVNVYQYPEGYWLGDRNPGPLNLLQGGTISGINFTLELGGAITGVVKDGGGNGIAGIWVEAYQDFIDAWSWAQTDETGTYRILGLPGGDYRVYINPQGGWIGQDHPANPVAVDPGLDTFDVNFTLVPDSTISGKVTDELGDHISERIDLAACLVADENTCWWATVQPDDTYTIIGLPGGEFTIDVYEVPGGNWIGETYPTTITLGVNEDIGGIDFKLEPEPLP